MSVLKKTIIEMSNFTTFILTNKMKNYSNFLKMSIIIKIILLLVHFN